MIKPFDVPDSVSALLLASGRAMLVVALAFVALNLLRSNRGAVRTWSAVLAAGAVVESTGYLLIAQGAAQSTGIVTALLLVASGAATTFSTHTRWREATALLSFAGVVFLFRFSSFEPFDVPGLATTAALVAALAIAIVMATRPRHGVTVPSALGRWFAPLIGIAVLGAIRSTFHIVSHDGYDGTLVLLQVTPLAALALAFVVSRVRFGARAALAVTASVTALVSITALVPVVSSPASSQASLISLDQAKDMVLLGQISMDLEAGAGPKDEYRGMSFEECDKIGSRDCFITHYDDIAMKKGVLAAVQDLAARGRNNQGVTFASHCHQVVHNLGQLSFELSNGFERAMVVDPQMCATGFTHGLWEAEFAFLGEEIIFTRISDLCRKLIPVSDWYQWSCSHILGHAVMTHMMEDPTRAMEYCSAVAEYNDRFNCIVGGWMNYFTDDVVNTQFERDGTLQDVFDVCYGAREGLLKYLCYQEIFPSVYQLLGNSDYLAGKACLTLSEPAEKPTGQPWDPNSFNYADRCIQGMARGIGALTQYDYRDSITHCRLMPPAAHDACLAAVSASITLNTGSVAAGNFVCEQVAIEIYRQYCYIWNKETRRLLASGPNKENLPKLGEIRLPQGKPLAILPPG